jgi:hypothetical protein
VLAAIPFLADAAEEGKDIITGMLIVGLAFVAIVLLGDAVRYLTLRRRAQRPARRL